MKVRIRKGGLERGKIAQKRTGLKKVILKGLSHFVGVGKGNFWERFMRAALA